jgi:hypothetical protein
MARFWDKGLLQTWRRQGFDGHGGDSTGTSRHFPLIPQ